MPKNNSRVLELIRKESKHVNKIVAQNKSKNIIAYCRVSDSKQIDNYSPEVQLNYIKRYAKENGLKIVKTQTVLGESSKRGSKRPSIIELEEFINASNHKIHSIVVFHSNRFTRDGIFGANFLDGIISKGIGFMDINDPNDIFTDIGRLRQIDNFYDAEYDNVNRKKFINAITLDKLKQGYTMRRPPRGYRLIKTKGKRDQLVIITEEGELIKQAFRLKLDYNYSNITIADMMQARGLKITNKALGKIFKNVYYCGFIKDTRLIEYNGYVQGRHPAMITPEEFETLNFSKPKNRSIRKNEIEKLPLRKHLICSKCNTKLSGYKASNRDDLFYYKCRTKGCGINIKNEIVHQLYLDFLNRFSFNQGYLPLFEKSLNEIFKMINKENADLKQQLVGVITQLKKERFIAIRNMNSFPEERNFYKELIEDCDNRLVKLKEQVGNIKFFSDEVKKHTYKVLNFINNISDIWENSDFVHRLKLQELMFPSGIWYSKSSNKLVTPEINPIFNIISDLKRELVKNSKKNGIKVTNKGGKNFGENGGEVRTLNFLNNMLVTPSFIGSYEHHQRVLRQEKIPLVVLLSSGSNITIDSTLDEIGNSTNSCFSGDLYDYMVEVIELTKLTNY